MCWIFFCSVFRPNTICNFLFVRYLNLYSFAFFLVLHLAMFFWNLFAFGDCDVAAFIVRHFFAIFFGDVATFLVLHFFDYKAIYFRISKRKFLNYQFELSKQFAEILYFHFILYSPGIEFSFPTNERFLTFWTSLILNFKKIRTIKISKNKRIFLFSADCSTTT